MGMVCTLPGGFQESNKMTMSWQKRRFEKFEVIGIGKIPSNKSKYSLDIQQSDQRLDYFIKVHIKALSIQNDKMCILWHFIFHNIMYN